MIKQLIEAITTIPKPLLLSAILLPGGIFALSAYVVFKFNQKAPPVTPETPNEN